MPDGYMGTHTHTHCANETVSVCTWPTQSDGAIWTQENVPRLEISVNTATLMNELQSYKQLLSNALDLRLRETMVQLCEQMQQIRTNDNKTLFRDSC